MQRVEFAENKWVREITFSKKEMEFRGPYGVVNIYFHTEDLLEKFELGQSLIALGGCWTAHLKQDHRLNGVFFEKDAPGAVDKAIGEIAKRFSIVLK